MKSSQIGGQAVIEGVMMKNKSKYAVAVRKPDGEIAIDIQEIKKERTGILKAPILRGMIAFVDSMVIGIKTLAYSASFFEEEDTPKDKNKNDKKAKGKQAKDKKSGDKQTSKGDSLLIFGTVAVSILFSVLIFMLLPMFLSRFLSKVIDSQLLLAVIEGVLRIAIFLGYVVAISQLNDIKRVFAYHGAEHKSINCVENGLELTVENVKKQSRQHKRCGTSFLLFVVVISLVFFLFIRVDQVWLQALIRVLLVPIIAGISYEIIRFAGNSENKVITAISKPGFALQKLTTKEPEDDMIEVAIASVEAVFDWKGFLSSFEEKAGRMENISKSKDFYVATKEVPGDESNQGKTEDTKPKKEKEFDLSSLDKKLTLSEEEKPLTFRDPFENKKTTVVPVEEEEDEVLSALDRYFVMDDDEK